MSVPIIKIEIEGMKESIQNALAVYNTEFNDMVSDAVDKSFTVETIQAKIDAQVEIALNNAIESLNEHYQIKTIVKDIVLKSLTIKRAEIANLQKL